jgi:hypothetical protein
MNLATVTAPTAVSPPCLAALGLSSAEGTKCAAVHAYNYGNFPL